MNTRRKHQVQETAVDEGENAGDTNNRPPLPQAPLVKGTTKVHKDADQTTPLTRVQKQAIQVTPPTVGMNSKLLPSLKASEN
jgi:hypothetical protein